MLGHSGGAGFSHREGWGASCWACPLPFQSTQTCLLCRLLKKQLNRCKDKLQAIYACQEEKSHRFETKIHELTTNQNRLWTKLQLMEQDLQVLNIGDTGHLEVWPRILWLRRVLHLSLCTSLWSASTLSLFSPSPDQFPLSSARWHLPSLWRRCRWERTVLVPISSNRPGAKRFFTVWIPKPLLSASLLDS